ncbi:MAG: phage integrase SAM-like domain-containing protein, partial [Rhodopirellula sp.]|nr:phage integrase SAM-like domain-containing protein [Rhodopirellula sp.]
MASISQLKDGRCRIEWYDGNGNRKSISLGKLSDRKAERIRDKVTELVQTMRLGLALDDSVGTWLAKLDDRTHGKLVKAGLTEARTKTVAASDSESDQPKTLGNFLTEYLAKRTDVEKSTMTFYGHTQRNLLTFFGEEKPLAEISEGDVDDFRRFLIAEPLAEVTANRRCSLAKTWLGAAVRYRLISVNPFQGVSAGRKSNSSRQRFIEPETIDRVIDAAPDAEWRLLIALARYGGLRVPSEPFSLRWCDVDWHRNRILITEPKTKHHEGKGTRE